MGWLDDNAIDITDRSPNGKDRPQRPATRYIVVHRIYVYDDDEIPDGMDRQVDRLVHLYTERAAGVATVTLPGSWASKQPTIRTWRTSGIPAFNRQRAYVPYGLVAARDGLVYRLLPELAQGAHAAGYNAEGIGFAIVGDFRSRDELEPWEIRAGYGGHLMSPAQLEAVRFVLRDLLFRYPFAEIVTHTETIHAQAAKRGRRAPSTAKACPGSLALDELAQAERWARLALSHIHEGAGRR